jgi:hypothetical protein
MKTTKYLTITSIRADNRYRDLQDTKCYVWLLH